MSDDPLILAIDQGTTNSKAILVDRRGAIVRRASRPVAVEFPQPGWVEQDARLLWSTVLECIHDCLESAGQPAIAAIGISNQRESGVAWDRRTGQPLGPVVSWQCRRSTAICDALREAGVEDEVRARTGLPLGPMFTASKWRWLLDSIPDGHERAVDGEICLGTVDSWLLWNLSGAERHLTDVSNASRTEVFDITERRWDAGLAGHFSIPIAALPEVRPSAARFGETAAMEGLPPGIPISGIAGDSHAALFAHANFKARSVKATYGTGSSLMMATGSDPRRATGLATTVAWGSDATEYALEGNIYATGAAVQWTADLLGLSHPSDVADLAAKAAPSHEVFVVPAFAGLGAPHWDESARGIVTGLTRDTGRIHVARAAIDAIAYQVRDVFEAMEVAVTDPLSMLLADGGVTRNSALMQFQADMLGVPVLRNNHAELSAMGAAYLAGLAVGMWAATDEIDALERSVDRFEPELDETTRDRHYQGWQEAVARARFRPS